MENNKENLVFPFSVDKTIDKSLSNSTKLHLKTGTISSLVGELDMQKEYLSKLKIQRQKTQKLHAQYVKLKKEKEKMKDDHDAQLLSTRNKFVECQGELNKRVDEWRQLDREVQRLKAQIDKLNREKSQSINTLKFSYDQSFMELKHNLDTLNQSLESKNKQLNNLKKSHNTKISELESEKNELEAACKSHEQKLKQAQDKRKDAEKIAGDLSKRIEDLLVETNRWRNQIDSKNKEVNTMKTSLQRSQLDNQSGARKILELEKQLNAFQERMSQRERENQKLRCKLDESEQKLRMERQQRQRSRSQQDETRSQLQFLKSQLHRKEETIKQYSNRILNREDEQLWKQRLAQKQSQNDELLDLIRNLKQENDSLMTFIRQKQLLERERRSLVEYEMEEISKFENLLKDVK